MASVTLSDGQTYYHDSTACTGLNNGETYTINRNSTLIIDQDWQWSLSHPKFPGPINVSDGKFIIDGTKIRSIFYTGHSGVLPSSGSVLTGLWSNVTGEIIYTGHYQNSGFYSGELKCRSLSGPMITNEPFANNDFSGYLSGTDRVGWILLTKHRADNSISPSLWTTTSLGSLIISGEWYDLGTGNGQTGQTFRYFIDNFVPAVWVETASGSDVYTRYINIHTARNVWDVIHLTGLSERWGNWCWQDTGRGNPDNPSLGFSYSGSRDIIFPSVSGVFIPSGAKVRVPNIHISEFTTTGRYSPTGYFSFLPLAMSTNNNIGTMTSTTAGGDVVLKRMSTVNFLSLVQTNNLYIESIGIDERLSIADISESLIIKDLALGSITGACQTYAISISNVNLSFLFSGWTITNACESVVSSSSIYLGFLSNGQMEDIDVYGIRLVPAGGYHHFRPEYCDNVSFNNIRLYGHDFYITTTNCTFLNLTCATDITGSGHLILPYNNGYWHKQRYAINILSTSDSNLIDGVTILPPFSLYKPIIFGAAKNNIIQNVGSTTNPVPYTLKGDSVFISGTLSLASAGVNDNRIQRLYLSGGAGTSSSSSYLYLTNDTNGAIIQNVYEFDTGINRTNTAGNLMGTLPKNCIIRGCYFSGATFPLPSTSNSSYNSSYYDYWFNEHSGFMNVMFSPGSNITGNFRGFSNGIIYFNNSGDYADFTWSYYIKGYTGFYRTGNVSPINLSTPSGVEIFYDIDNSGTGFYGEWRNTGQIENEILDPYFGFKPKFRMICRGPNTPQTRFVITGLTNWDLITGSLYPLNSVNTSLVINGLETGSEVRVYKSSNLNYIAGIESSDTSFTYNYVWEGEDISIDIIIMSLGYIPIRYNSQTLGEDGLSLFVQQKLDRIYLNPN